MSCYSNSSDTFVYAVGVQNSSALIVIHQKKFHAFCSDPLPAVVLQQNMLFLTCFSNNITVLTAYSEDFSTLLWSFTLPTSSEISQPTLSYDLTKLFIRAGETVIALDSLTGKLLWSFYRQIPFFGFLNHVPPAVSVDDKLVFVSGLFEMVALSASTGTLVWNNTLSYLDRSLDAPLPGQSILYVAHETNGIYGLEPTTGNLLFNNNLAGDWLWPSTTAIDGSDNLYQGLIYGGLIALNSKGQTLWRVESGEPTFEQPFLGWKGGDKVVVGRTVIANYTFAVNVYQYQ